MNQINLHGTGVAIVTPFRSDKSIDFSSLKKLINHLINGAVDYLVVMGTTGEAATLSNDEKRAVLDYVIDVVAGRIPIVAGFGGNNTQDIVNQLKTNDFTGIDAVLSVAPYYNKPNQRGLYIHYKEIANASPVPVILYNVPGRTGSNIAPETVIKLANDFEKIIAIKEASGNFAQIMQIIKNKPADFCVISGDDALTLPLISIGVQGVISVTANIIPSKVKDMVKAALDGDFDTALQIHYSILELTNLLFEDGNPSGIKAALSIKGIIENYLRPPLVPVNQQTFKKIEYFLNKN